MKVLGIIVTVLGVLLALIGTTGDTGMVILGVVCAIIGVINIVVGVKRGKAKKERIAEVGSEQYKAEQKESRKQRREAAMADITIDYVVVAGQESKTSLGSALVRGSVFGIAGVASASKNTEVMVVIHYKSGRTETKKLKMNSGEFKRLAKYIKA